MAVAPTVAVLGTGAVGCYFAGILLESGASVAIVTRDSPSSKAREAAFRNQGLVMSSVQKSGVKTSQVIAPDILTRACARPEALATCDTIFVTVKRPGNKWVAEVLCKHAKTSAFVVCLQNGIRQREELISLAAGKWGSKGQPKILESVLVIAANLAEPNESLYYPQKMDMLAVEGGGELAAAAEQVAAMVAKAGFPAKAEVNFAAMQRSKLALNMNNAVGALMGLTVQEALLSATGRKLMGASIAEAHKVYTAEGYQLDPKIGVFLKVLSAPACLFACMGGLLPAPGKGFRSSMNQDLVAADGRDTEVAYLNGEVVAAGARVGVPTPLASKVVEVIEEMQAGKRERRVLTAREVEGLFFSPV